MTALRSHANVVLCSLAILLPAVVAAQSHPMAGTSASIPYPSDGYGTLQPGGPEAAENHLRKDREFIKNGLQFDSAEARVAQLTRENSQSQNIRQLGEKLAEDQKQLNSQLDSIAKQLAVAAPRDLTRKDKQAVANLAKLSGEQFDQELIRFVASYHQQRLKECNSEMTATQDPAIRDAARDWVTVLSQHLQLIEQIAQSHNLTIKGLSKGISGN